MIENVSMDISKAIPKKRWMRIIPVITLIYILSYMDRTNISFALAAGMSEDLAIGASTAGLASGIFFIGYLVLQVPGGQYAEKKSAKRFITCSILAWSVLAIITGFVKSVPQLLVIRFLLGVSESGVFPAALTLLSHWFPNEERGRATSFLIMNNPIAAVITGPISGFILARYNWHMVFIIEGCISLALILIWLPFMSDRPEDAKWLSKEEKNYITRRLKEEQEEIRQCQAKGKSKVTLKDIMGNIQMWKLILIFFFYQTGVYGFSLWLPTILKNLTKSGIAQIGILSIFPFIGAIIGLIVFGNLSDRSMKRKKYVIIPLLGFAVCLFLSLKTQGNVWLSFSFLIGCGVFWQASSSIFWTIPNTLFTADIAGGARGIINAIGNLGGFVGPFLVGALIEHSTYSAGIYSLVISLVVAALITKSLPRDGECVIQNK